MKYMVSILIYISGTIGFLVFSLLVLPAIFLLKPETYDPFIKKCCRLFLKTVFVNVKVEGIEKLNPDRTCIFTCNHVNLFDGFIFLGYIPNRFRIIGLAILFRYPILGTIIRKYGMIRINPKDPEGAMQSLEEAKKALNRGISILILPEGHRTLDGKLQPFSSGAFYLAHHAKANIFPTALVGAYEIKKFKRWLIKPGTVVFKFGDMLPYSSYRELNILEVRDLVREKTQQLLDENT